MGKENKKIGIIGVGVVGDALAKVISNPILYDKYKNIGSIDAVNRADIIFICVPTPYKKEIGFDGSMVEEAISIIKRNKIIVIKSTVLPGTTEKMQKMHPSHKILFNPEFLKEVSAEEDMKKPYEQIIGYTELSKNVAKEILKILPKAPAEFIIPAVEAEMVKYFSNTFLATKVIFANQIYDLCQKLGVNYDSIKEMARTNPRFSFSHFDIWADGYRGYSGKCLPKDVKSLIQLGDKVGVDLSLLKKVDEINEKLLRNNKKEK
jgi:UDPglucose 6-dehydrogenase